MEAYHVVKYTFKLEFLTLSIFLFKKSIFKVGNSNFIAGTANYEIRVSNFNPEFPTFFVLNLLFSC